MHEGDQRMKQLVFLGPPGAGKGTMAGMLCEQFSHQHISTGDILRAAMKSGSELGSKAQEYVNSGTLVPDELVAAIVSEKLTEPAMKNNGFILDGFPRTVKQADLLQDALDRNGMALDAVILFEVGEELLLKRLTARRICRDCGAVFNVIFNPPETDGICDKCGGELYQRSDDSIETAKDRLDVYERQTAPLIDYYEDKDLLIRVSGAQEKEANYQTLLEALGL
jgi:adenylate kinase